MAKSRVIDVYLRHVDEGEGIHLATVATAAEVEALLDSTRRFGVHAGGDMHYDALLQYVLTDDDAYAELVVGIE